MDENVSIGLIGPTKRPRRPKPALTVGVKWDDRYVNLTKTELKIVALLMTTARVCTLREIYDAMKGPGFVAGEGDKGYQAAVRTAVKRTRRKFCAIDQSFDMILTVDKFGYIWR